MKMSEMKAMLDGPSYGEDPEVVIRVDKPSIGPLATVPVKSIGIGFDWDNGKLIINPASPLVPKSQKEQLYDDASNFIFNCACGRNKNVASEAKRLLIKSGHDPARLDEFIKGVT